MKVVKSLLAAVSFSVLGGLSVAQAADLDAPAPPMMNDTSCVYSRVDAGGAFYNRPNVSAPGVVFGGSGNANALDEKIGHQAFIEFGTGCQITDIMRVEVTGGYRFKTSITDPYATLNMNLTTYTTFANVYWDITNYAGWTPYLGGGIGMAYHVIDGVSLPVTATGKSRASFAYNLTAGVSYDISDVMKLDVAYRFTDLGYARSGGATPVTVDDMRAHEIKVGLRYTWGSW